MSAAAALQLRQVLAAIDNGDLTASARERAYIAGAAHALESLAPAVGEMASEAG
jgi:hypothetical protein